MIFNVLFYLLFKIWFPGVLGGVEVLQICIQYRIQVVTSSPDLLLTRMYWAPSNSTVAVTFGRGLQVAWCVTGLNFNNKLPHGKTAHNNCYRPVIAVHLLPGASQMQNSYSLLKLTRGDETAKIGLWKPSYMDWTEGRSQVNSQMNLCASTHTKHVVLNFNALLWRL